MTSRRARNTKWAEGLGIKHQVSSFTTEYPSGQQRVKNIHRGADLLNNTVVEPGQVFSLNQTIGPRTEARGFVTAPVFAEGEFFDDFGGGVSQLATTTYNAAFFAGYQDVTHQPHTIYISRYPPGREATVNYGAIDLQFRDDSPHGILIRTYYSDTSVTVALYGDTEGRTAREENRAETNPVPVGDETFQCPAPAAVDPHNVCGTLAAGDTRAGVERRSRSRRRVRPRHRPARPTVTPGALHVALHDGPQPIRRGRRRRHDHDHLTPCVQLRDISLYVTEADPHHEHLGGADHDGRGPADHPSHQRKRRQLAAF